MPLFRKFPEIRKFQIKRRNFRKNKTVSLDKKQKLSKRQERLEKRKMYQNSHIKNQNGNLFHTLVISLQGSLVQLLSAS